MKYKPLFFKKGLLYLLDQKTLPQKIQYKSCRMAEDVARAIKDMVIRGAPLIGQAAVWGLYLDCSKAKNLTQWNQLWQRASKKLAASRPTGRNLLAALEAVNQKINSDSLNVSERQKALLKTLLDLEREWESITNRLAKHGASLLKSKTSVLTHCNTGRLATLGRGTALAVIEEGFIQGKVSHVYAGETRPYLQGARLTMWELKQMAIPSTLICDNMVAHLLAKRSIGAIFVGCDRVAANGDTANKIGTLGIAILAKRYQVPFYIVAPKETIDASIATGQQIPIEERDAKEVLEVAGNRIAPKGSKAWHPAFDVTPHELITGIITEDGVWNPNPNSRA